jgi:hypothetical protein
LKKKEKVLSIDFYTEVLQIVQLKLCSKNCVYPINFRNTRVAQSQNRAKNGVKFCQFSNMFCITETAMVGTKLKIDNSPKPQTFS